MSARGRHAVERQLGRMLAMNFTHRIPTAIMVLAVGLIGCSQSAANPTAGAQSTSNSPLARSSAAPSVAASPTEAAAPQPPVEFTGRITCGPPVGGSDESEEKVDLGDGMVLTRYPRGAWRQSVTMTDPRLEGIAYHTLEVHEYRENALGVWAATRRIVNDEGAWVARDYGGSYSDGTSIGDDSKSFYIGEGAYTGMIALTEETPLEGSCGVDVRGVIFAGAPVPEPHIPG